jgi:hypothetical protein
MDGEGRLDERTISARVLKEVRNLTIASNTVVLADIQKHVLRKALEPDYERDLSMLHPSEMCKSDWCWRADFYRIQGVERDPKALNPSFRLENVWTEGHDIHHKYQSWLWDMRVLYGVFYCARCDNKWWDVSPQECFYCDASREHLEFKELPLEAPHLRIGGHADGGLMLDPFRLLEIKSIGINSLRFDAPHLWDMYQRNETLDKIWMEINRPFPSHVRQGSLYLYMASRGWAEVPVPMSMVFIYEAKWNQQVKEFEVAYSPRWVEKMLAGAQMVVDAMEYGRPPQRPSWATDSQVAGCRSCPYRNRCWKIREHGQSDAPPIPVKRAPVAVRRRALARKAGAPSP